MTDDPEDKENPVRELRIGLGLNQAELAKLIGTTQSQVSRLERGDREMRKKWAGKLAEALKTIPGRLIFPEGSLSVGFDDRLVRLSKATWMPREDLRWILETIDRIIRAAELREPPDN